MNFASGRGNSRLDNMGINTRSRTAAEDDQEMQGAGQVSWFDFDVCHQLRRPMFLEFSWLHEVYLGLSCCCHLKFTITLYRSSEN